MFPELKPKPILLALVGTLLIIAVTILARQPIQYLTADITFIQDISQNSWQRFELTGFWIYLAIISFNWWVAKGKYPKWMILACVTYIVTTAIPYAYVSVWHIDPAGLPFSLLPPCAIMFFYINKVFAK